MIRVLVVTTLVGWLMWSAAASAQLRLRVRGLRPLEFGEVIAGVATTVAPTDASRAGFFRIMGERSQEVQLHLDLPRGLKSAGGAWLAIDFGPSDAAWLARRRNARSERFDPHVGLLALLNGNGKSFVQLGGTVSPGSNQPAGLYTGTVTLQIAYTGN